MIQKGCYVKVERNNIIFWVIYDKSYKDEYFWGVVDNHVRGLPFKYGDKVLFKIDEAISYYDVKHYKYRVLDRIKLLEDLRKNNDISIKI